MLCVCVLLTASRRPMRVGVFSIRASKTSSDSDLTYRSTETQRVMQCSPVSPARSRKAHSEMKQPIVRQSSENFHAKCNVSVCAEVMRRSDACSLVSPLCVSSALICLAAGERLCSLSGYRLFRELLESHDKPVSPEPPSCRHVPDNRPLLK